MTKKTKMVTFAWVVLLLALLGAGYATYDMARLGIEGGRALGRLHVDLFSISFYWVFVLFGLSLPWVGVMIVGVMLDMFLVYTGAVKPQPLSGRRTLLLVVRHDRLSDSRSQLRPTINKLAPRKRRLE